MSNALAYCALACVIFWLTLAALAPKLAAVLFLGGLASLALLAVLPKRARKP